MTTFFDKPFNENVLLITSTNGTPRSMKKSLNIRFVLPFLLLLVSTVGRK